MAKKNELFLAMIQILKCSFAFFFQFQDASSNMGDLGSLQSNFEAEMGF